MGLNDQLNGLSDSLKFMVPELILLGGLCLVLLIGLILRQRPFVAVYTTSFLTCSLSALTVVLDWPDHPTSLVAGMLRFDDFSSYWKVLADVGALLTMLMTGRSRLEKPAEYFVLLITVVLGAHLLTMSMNFIMVILSLELLSLSSYALAGWGFSKAGAEASLKYFLFGSAATASMVYGMSLLYGMSGTLDFSSEQFVTRLTSGEIDVRSPLLTIAGFLTLAGFLFKMGAAPMHFWAPDVYQSAPTPVVAFLSVVPKLAGLGALTKFVLAINLFGQTRMDWSLLLAILASLSIAIGNFSALAQSNPKRMMAYSSIAQAGFLLVGIVPVSLSGVHATQFYAAVLLVMNFLTFHTIQQFERKGASTMATFSGLGRTGSLQSVALTIGLLALVGLPITAGFNAKLFIFSGLWEAYGQTHKMLLVSLLVFGLVNTVVSLFYYMRIPYFLFLKDPVVSAVAQKNSFGENLLSLILVLALMLLFFRPDLLMGWIIRVNFVL